MSATQIQAAQILLKKTMPDLSASEVTAEHVHRYVARIPEKAHTSKEWQQQHGQKSPGATLQ